jgi:hypothetical protein
MTYFTVDSFPPFRADDTAEEVFWAGKNPPFLIVELVV